MILVERHKYLSHSIFHKHTHSLSHSLTRAHTHTHTPTHTHKHTPTNTTPQHSHTPQHTHTHAHTHTHTHATHKYRNLWWLCDQNTLLLLFCPYLHFIHVKHHTAFVSVLYPRRPSIA